MITMDTMSRPKWNLYAITIAAMVFAAAVGPATSQHTLENSPPVMYGERNWRISESEQVGSVIARVQAGDSENDQLQFGLEPLFHGNYANPNSTGTTNDKLPFRIDPDTGIVYLNESLAGRGGENFFLYVTVSDGQLTAKNEVYVNIYARNDNKIYGSRPPSITQAVRNISQFPPLFHMLPGVPQIRDQPGIRYPGSNVPPGFALNNIFQALPQPPPRPSYALDGSKQQHQEQQQEQQRPPQRPSSADDGSTSLSNEPNAVDSSTTRTKLTPIGGGSSKTNITDAAPNQYETHRQSTAKKGALNGADAGSQGGVESENDNGPTTASSPYAIGTIIPVIITVCGMFAAAGFIVLFIYRKRLCAISKNLKKKSKEEMAKKSNQSNLSSNLTDDSRNSMVLQQWHGPTAFGNRYVPWERDQQQQQQLQMAMATSQLSTSATGGIAGSGGDLANENGAAGGFAGIGGGNGGVGGTLGKHSSGGGGTAGDRWEFPRHRLKFFNILGEGAFGQVWRCEATDIDGYEGVTTVAVKTLKENATEMEKHDLVSELQVMKSLEPHINVVRLLGCCTDKDPIFVIIEYVNRGKLQTYLRSSRAERHYGNTHGKSNILTSGDLTSFMYQVAKGMDYLTSRGIIHRDLAARNILITDDNTCKVADFGFARDIVTSKVYERKSEGKLPIRWMAIESLYDNIFSVKSDIWSFGILMWEIVTLGSTPYPGISAADVMRKVRDGYRLEKPEHCRRELYNIMYYCWAQDAIERPTFSEIVQMLDKLLHTEMDYIELERFPDHNYYNILNLSGEKL